MQIQDKTDPRYRYLNKAMNNMDMAERDANERERRKRSLNNNLEKALGVATNEFEGKKMSQREADHIMEKIAKEYLWR